MKSWTEKLAEWMEFMAANPTGQAAMMEMKPPDERVPVRLECSRAGFVVVDGTSRLPFSSGEADRAILAYAAAVEGNA